MEELLAQNGEWSTWRNTFLEDFKNVVRPARVERATPCLEGRCSIQLSYGRKPTRPHSMRAQGDTASPYGAAQRESLFVTHDVLALPVWRWWVGLIRQVAF